MAHPTPYFNRHGDMVIPVDTVEAWLKAMAATAKTPDEFTMIVDLTKEWTDGINTFCLLVMEAKDKS